MVARARELGLRTGGHVPAFMTARQAVEAGYDELHHINQVTLNFLVSQGDDTRTLLRFNLPGDKAADLQLNDRRTQDFLALLKKKGTVVDPTMTAFEAQYTQRQGQPNPSYAMVAANLPAVVQRSLPIASRRSSKRAASTGKKPAKTTDCAGRKPGSWVAVMFFSSTTVSPTRVSATCLIEAVKKPISPGPSSSTVSFLGRDTPTRSSW